MYKQEKYVNKKLDPQKKKSVHSINANTVRSHVAQLMTLMQWRSQTRASQGIARASDFFAPPSAPRVIIKTWAG